MPSWFDQEVDALARRTRGRWGEDKLILFYGSSTFTLWHDLPEHFPAYNVLNHGFGGSTLKDCLEYFDRLVGAVRPEAVILYAGDNDLDNGASPEAVLGDVGTFIARKRRALGDIPMAYVSIKVSPARLHFMHKIAYTNRIIERFLHGQADVRFLDITRRMVGSGFLPWRRCYGEDPLHMNRQGYRIWGKSLTEFLVALGEEGRPIETRPAGALPAWAVSETAVAA
jgi:lysophospholipase L1-like esterase